jgi:hypothetical protein
MSDAVETGSTYTATRLRLRRRRLRLLLLLLLLLLLMLLLLLRILGYLLAYCRLVHLIKNDTYDHARGRERGGDGPLYSYVSECTMSVSCALDAMSQ